MSTRESVEQTLRTTKDREYAAAKNGWRLIVSIQVASLAVAVFGASEPSSPMGIALGIWTFIGPVALFLLKRCAGKHYRTAEKIRRMELLHDGLGRAPSATELALLSVDAPVSPVLERPPVLPYFTSDAPHGTLRLLHIVQQSAFFTRRLAMLSACYSWIATGLGAVITVVLFLFAIRDPARVPVLASGFDGELLSRVAATLLAFFSAGVFADLASSFGSLARTASETLSKCTWHIENPDIDPWAQYLLLSDYDCALASAPPLPATVYALHGRRLQKVWMGFGAKTPGCGSPSDRH